MQVRVGQRGNNIGVRIPRDIAQRFGLVAGSTVEIEATGKRITITAAQPPYRLEDLLANVTPKAMREAFDWGSDRGHESIEP